MRFLIRILPVFLLVISLIGCSGGGPVKKYGLQPEKNPESKKDNVGSKQEAGTNLPWENNPEFMKACREHHTPVLMASYRATLPDPILYERHNISLAADYLSGAVVKPGEVFSLNSRIGWRSAQRGFKLGPMYSGGHIVSTVGGGVCKIASVIYNVAILADQEIIERHQHSMTVPYVPPGQDATISYGTKDFKFRNTTDAPLLIWAQNAGGTLYIAFYGSAKPPRVRWVHKTLSRSDTWTEYVNDNSLPEGAERIIFEGSEGVTVHSWIVISKKGGREVIKDLGISAYRPAPRVVSVNR